MKQIIYIITLLASAMCFSSCGSHKSTMKQETVIESGSNHQRKDTASFSEQVKKTEAEDVTETIEEVTTVYDTTQPVDRAGKRPVLSETKKTTKRESNKQKQEDKATNLNQSSAEQSNDSTKIEDKKEKDKQKDETTVPRQICGVVWGLVALIGVGIVWWMVYRWRKSIKLKKRNDFL